MATGSSELTMLTARRWVQRNAKKARSSSNHRALQLCPRSVRIRALTRRLLQLSTKDSTQSSVSYSTTLHSQSTTSNTAKFQHIRADTRKMPVSSHITTHGSSVLLLTQAKVTRHSSTIQKSLLHSLKKLQTSTRLNHTFTDRWSAVRTQAQTSADQARTSARARTHGSQVQLHGTW